jgi:hypothetical protein
LTLAEQTVEDLIDNLDGDNWFDLLAVIHDACLEAGKEMWAEAVKSLIKTGTIPVCHVWNDRPKYYFSGAEEYVGNCLPWSHFDFICESEAAASETFTEELRKFLQACDELGVPSEVDDPAR